MINALIDVLVQIIDFVTIVIIFGSFSYAVIQLIFLHLHRMIGRKYKGLKVRKIRIQLGEYLLLALEIFICADIILSVQDPSLEHLTQLAVIVVLRIVIAYFLQYEIKQLSSVKESKQKNDI